MRSEMKYWDLYPMIKSTVLIWECQQWHSYKQVRLIRVSIN
jgi:hypothetical protein